MQVISTVSQPWSLMYQRQADEAFARDYEMSADQIRLIRPPLLQIRFLPPRFGYPDYVDRQMTVMQVFGITRLPSGRIPGLPQTRGEDRVDYSRNQSAQQGSTRLSNGGDPLGLGGASW